jgi:hypothetical protein
VHSKHCTATELIRTSCTAAATIAATTARYVPVRKQNKAHLRELQQSLDDLLLLAKVKAYIPGAVLRTLKQESPEDEYWSSELRRTSVMFVSLGLREQHLLAAAKYDEAMQEVHSVMVAAQESVYEYEGSINKCLMDDKGAFVSLAYCSAVLLRTLIAAS